MASCFNAIKHCFIRALTELESTLFWIGIYPHITVGAIQVTSNLDNIIAAVGIAAQHLIKGIHVGMAVGMFVFLILYIGLSICQKYVASLLRIERALADKLGYLQIACCYRAAKHIHLTAVIVDVILTIHHIPSVLKNVAHRIAQSTPTAMANMQRTGWVCRDKLVIDVQAMAYIYTRKVVALFTHLTENISHCCNRQVEVNKTRAGNLYMVNCFMGWHMSNNGSGYFCRSHFCETCGAQSHGGSPLAMIGIGWTLNTTILHFKRRQLANFLSSCDSLLNKLLDGLGHLFSFSSPHSNQIGS